MAKAALRNSVILGAALIIAFLHIALTFPRADQYRTGADEGTYYRQAKLIQGYGIQGFRLAAEGFIQDRNSHIFPPPLRVLPLALDAAALSISDSYESLSWLSLIFFMLLCVISYYYLKDLWDPDLALISVVLLAFSPLGGAMAKRALIDSFTYLVTALSLLSFLAWIVRRTSRTLAIFSISLLLVQLTRETGFLVYPFYLAVLLFLKYRERAGITLRDIAICFLVPVLGTAIVYQVLYGLPAVYGVVEAIYTDNLMNPSAYVLNYSSGPWYRYLVDFMLLSPVTILLAFMYSGYYLLRKTFDAKTSVLLGFFGYTIAVYAFLQMNVRYVITLDLVIRILASLAVGAAVSGLVHSQRKKSLAAAAIVVLLVIMDIRSYTRFFVAGNAYDPVSYNLLYTEKFVPTVLVPHPQAPAP